MIFDPINDEPTNDYESPEVAPLEPFFAEGLISDIVRTEKSGKEGTVYCCRAAPTTGFEFLAAKVYRPRSQRNFKNDAVYTEGRLILDRRAGRAVAKKTQWGKQAQFGLWVFQEYETLVRLHALQSDVPEPLRMAGSVILMEYVGDEEGAAPKLKDVALAEDEVRPLFNRLLANIELWLANDLVHGDLSPYNILYWNGKLTVIDFPQAVDPRANRNAYDLLCRDVENVCRYWSRYGVRSDPGRISDHLWSRFIRSEL